MTRSISWFVMTLLAVGVAGYAVVSLVVPGARTGFVEELFADTPIAIGLHLGGGAIAIVLGALQFSTTLRNRYLAVHRRLGQIYILSVVASGIAGLLLAIESTGGLVSHFGFGAMAVVWVFTALVAWRKVLDRDIEAHRAWMLRSYAVTLAAVTLRIYLPLSQIAGIPFEEAYPAISWMCWVPNLIIVEWFMIEKTRKVAHR
ncbi:MAG: DUF2306 domain-containing protein [Woeseiaceae bacterium]|nr:DUF2306 domain-containing protein [Woeseiaceae bacterium]